MNDMTEFGTEGASVREELAKIDLELNRLTLKERIFSQTRDEHNFKLEDRYFKRDLVEHARRNLEVIDRLVDSEIVTKSEVRDATIGYLKVMENVIELNK